MAFAISCPHTAAWMRSFYALHEWVGLIAYRFGACPVTSAPSVPAPSWTGPAFAAFPGLDALSGSASDLLDSTGRERLFTSRPWYESFVAAGLQPDAAPLFFVLDDAAGKARAVLPCQRRSAGEPSVSSLTSFYSCDFRPLIAPDADANARPSISRRSLSQHLSAEAVIGFDSLDSGLPVLKPFLDGLRRPGRAVLRLWPFGRWWENVAGRSFPEYLAARDGALREVIRRNGGKLERAGATLSMVDAASTADEIEQGIADYEAVYCRKLEGGRALSAVSSQP